MLKTAKPHIKWGSEGDPKGRSIELYFGRLWSFGNLNKFSKSSIIIIKLGKIDLGKPVVNMQIEKNH